MKNIKLGTVPSNYKKTKKGNIIPFDWEVKDFYSCVSIVNGQVDPTNPPYIDMKHVGLENIEKHTGRLLFIKTAREEKLTSGKYFFNKGTVLYGKIRPELRKVYYAEFDGICSADIYPLKPKENLYPKFLKYLITDERFYRFAVSASMRTGMPKINRDDIGGYYFLIPKKAEQEQIANILSTWDKAIELKEKLIDEKKKQKAGLMQKLLTGNVRFTGFNDAWEEVKFGKVFKFLNKERVSEPQNYKLLTVKLHLKGIEATEKYPNDTKNGRPYYLREPNEILIGRQNYHNGGIGIVPSNMKNYIASNAISSLTTIKGDLMFLFYYISNVDFYKRVGHMIGGTGQKEISETTMKNLVLRIPKSLEEQKKIGEVLKTADNEIDLLEKELESLKQQKKGLMQLLLTGIIRVNTQENEKR